MTFQDLFKEIQDLLYQLKPKRFTHFSQKIPDNKKKTNERSLRTKIRPCEVAVFVLQHFRIKNILTNSIFLLFLEIEKNIFCLFGDFKEAQPKFKDFLGPGNFPPIFQDYSGFSRTVPYFSEYKSTRCISRPIFFNCKMIIFSDTLSISRLPQSLFFT